MNKIKHRVNFGWNPPKSIEAKKNWERCNIKGSNAGKIAKVVDMRKK